jgi:hypothetical protein
VGARESAKGQSQGLLGRFYRARRGRRGDGRGLWPLMAMTVAGSLDCIKGERLMAEGN